MQNTNKDGSMVGMDQCRISSVDSTTSDPSHLSFEGPGMCSSSSRAPLLFNQKSRGSSSSCGGDSGGATEVEPLIPEGSSSCEEGGHKLQFDPKSREEEISEVEEDDEDEGETTAPVDEELSRKEDGVNLIKEEKDCDKECHGKGSNDTVCTTSSSTTSAAGNVSQSSNKSSKAGKSKNRNKRLRHLSTDTDDTSDISATLEPPDGGWGWVVVVASFLVNLIADGVTFSFGVFFNEFTHYFKQSESTTAWIGSLLAAMPLLSGPVASWLTDRYGCRKVTIVGGLLAAFGFFLSSYTTSIYVLMLTFGVITGFGLSLCYVAAVVIVAYYFERKRSFATGLSVCGGGIGTFLFAPISQYLIDLYGWQTTTLILAGAFLLLCICGLVMKDLEWTKRKNKSSNNNNTHSHNHSLSHHHGCGAHCSPNHQQSDKSNLTRKANRRCNSAICIPTFVQEQERRERRQRYYSCNQDGKLEGDGTGNNAPERQDLIDRSGGTRQSKGKGKRLMANKEIDNEYFLPASPDLVQDRSYWQAPPMIGEDTTDGTYCSNNHASMQNPDLQEQQQLLQPELLMIPEEKDTLAPTSRQPGDSGCPNCSDSSSDPCNAEIDIAHHQKLIPGSALSGEPHSGATESSTNLRNLQLNNNYNNNNHDKLCIIADSSATPLADSVANPDEEACRLLCHNNLPTTTYCNNNDSNNSSSNNNSVNGVLRNGSNQHFLQCNNHSVTSFPTQTVTAGPNGIPTIIIPPAQQMKQSVNTAKMDMINSARYRSVMHRHSLTYRGAVLNLKRYRLRPASSCPDIISVATSTDGRGSFELMNVVGDVCRWIHGVCEWENLMNTRFLLFILSNLLLYAWYDIPYMYLQTAAVRHGYSEDLSSYLISSIGLSNVVGNILLGYLGDKKWASATIVYGVCMIICGITTIIMPYLMEWDYWSLVTICGLFGLTIAANYALTSVILVQVVSLERFANAYGLLLLVQGIGNLVGPPIAGVISDMTGTTTWSFLVAGVGIFASSFFVLAPIFQREIEPDTGGGGHHPVEVSHNNNSV